MALQSSGSISFRDLNQELGNSLSSQLDMRTAASEFGLGTPDSMGEFYGLSLEVSISLITLGYTQISLLEACNEFLLGGTVLVYIDDVEFSNATSIYSNSSGTTSAPTGFYSDGDITRNWNGTVFTETSICSL